MYRLSKLDYFSILEASLKWNECDDAERFVHQVKAGLKSLLPTVAEIEIEREPVNEGDSTRTNISDGQKSEIRIQSTKSVCRVTLVAESGDTMLLIIARRESVFDQREIQFVHEAASHILAAHEQLSHLESLRITLARLEEERKTSQTESLLTSSLPFETLTKRERQTVEQVGKGLSNGQIAEYMGISRRTVEKHLESIYQKLGLENRYQLIRELVT